MTFNTSKKIPVENSKTGKKVSTLMHSLHTRLLPSAIGCAHFITSQIILKSMFLRFRLQTYFESTVSFLYMPRLKDLLWLAYLN